MRGEGLNLPRLRAWVRVRVRHHMVHLLAINGHFKEKRLSDPSLGLVLGLVLVLVLVLGLGLGLEQEIQSCDPGFEMQNSQEVDV